MEIFEYPARNSWIQLMRRPALAQVDLQTLVIEIFSNIRKEGDEAVKRYSLAYDKMPYTGSAINNLQMKISQKLISKELRHAIRLAKSNIEKFHKAQREKKSVIETTPGVRCWRESRPIEKVGIYIPGGSAPLFSTVLMLGVPAQLAGCNEIVLFTPPDLNGNIHPAIVYAAQLVGITKIFKVGGIQAIGAMAFGTESIPKVDKIFGPGNQYVTAAKQAAQQFGIAIDMPAGPSELLIIADASCYPEFVAADLLSQAEHGPDSQVILLSDSKEVVTQTRVELERQLTGLPRKDIALQALANSKSMVLNSIDDCIEYSNLYAPEHLILAVKNHATYIEKISNAGSVFLGNYSCESAGDYASGTNHTLPTNGYARSYSGVSLDSFLKKITFQELTSEGIRNIGPSIELMAEAEQLFGHRNAVSVRLKRLP